MTSKPKSINDIFSSNKAHFKWTIGKQSIGLLQKMEIIKSDIIDNKWQCQIINDNGVIKLSLVLLQIPPNVKSLQCEWTINVPHPNWLTRDTWTHTFTYCAMHCETVWNHALKDLEDLVTSIKGPHIIIDIETLHMINYRDQYIDEDIESKTTDLATSCSQDLIQMRGELNQVWKICASLYKDNNALLKSVNRLDYEVKSLKHKVGTMKDNNTYLMLEAVIERNKEMSTKTNTDSTVSSIDMPTTRLQSTDILSQSAQFSHIASGDEKTLLGLVEESDREGSNMEETLYKQSKFDSLRANSSTLNKPLLINKGSADTVSSNLNDINDSIKSVHKRQIRKQQTTEHSVPFTLCSYIRVVHDTEYIVTKLMEHGFNKLKEHCKQTGLAFECVIDKYEGAMIRCLKDKHVDEERMKNITREEFVDMVYGYIDASRDVEIEDESALRVILSRLFTIIDSYDSL